VARISRSPCEHRERELQGHRHRGSRYDDDVLGPELRHVHCGLLAAAASAFVSATLAAASSSGSAPSAVAAACSPDRLRQRQYGRVGGVSNSLTRLTVTFRGSHSAACTQAIYLWNWSSGYWVRYSSTTAGGPTETEASFTVTGALASHVSGSTGDGDVAVRVHCTRTDSVGFTTSGDLMRVTFWRPA
jgi:hypothetical protein